MHFNQTKASLGIDINSHKALSLKRRKCHILIIPNKYITWLLSGVPDYFGRNKISSGGDLSHYSSASLY